VGRLPAKCPYCRADSLTVDDRGAACAACGYRAEGGEAAKEWAASNLEPGRRHSGAGLPVFECPGCSVEALVELGGESGAGRPAYLCFSCGGSWEKDELECCPECNRLRPRGGFEELVICRSAVGFYVCGECYARVFRT